MNKKIIKLGSTLALASSLLGAFLVILTILTPLVVQAADDTATEVPSTFNIKIHKVKWYYRS